MLLELLFFSDLPLMWHIAPTVTLPVVTSSQEQEQEENKVPLLLGRYLIHLCSLRD